MVTNGRVASTVHTSGVGIAQGVLSAGDDTGVVGMASGNGVVLGKTSIDLTNGVGIRVSLSLADGVVASISSIGRVGSVVHTSVGIVQRVGGVGNDTRVVSMASGNGIGQRKTSSNLANGVGIRVRLS